MALAKFVIANGDGPYEPGAVLENTDAFTEDINFYEEGARLATWLAWNSTPLFTDGFGDAFQEAREEMNKTCDKFIGTESGESLTDNLGFPIDTD